MSRKPMTRNELNTSSARKGRGTRISPGQDFQKRKRLLSSIVSKTGRRRKSYSLLDSRSRRDESFWNLLEHCCVVGLFDLNERLVVLLGWRKRHNIKT